MDLVIRLRRRVLVVMIMIMIVIVIVIVMMIVVAVRVLRQARLSFLMGGEAARPLRRLHVRP